MAAPTRGRGYQGKCQRATDAPDHTPSGQDVPATLTQRQCAGCGTPLRNPKPWHRLCWPCYAWARIAENTISTAAWFREVAK